jgi:RND family efflux transporter MFP subunit
MRADFEQAKAQLELSIGSAAKVKVNRAKGDLEETEAELQSLEAGVEIARLNFSRTKLTAAIDGTISRPSIDSGNLVTAGETVLATLVATDPILVDFNIDEPSFLRMRKAVRVGNLKPSEIAVSIRLGDESEFKRTGKLEGLDGAQNSPHGFVLRGLLANTDRELVPGLVANVRVNLRDKPSNALVVPQGAVYGKSDGGLFVFVVNGQNVLEERSVQVAGRFDEFKVVGAGLEAGEWIVDKLRIPVYAGMKVEPVRDGGK